MPKDFMDSLMQQRHWTARYQWHIDRKDFADPVFWLGVFGEIWRLNNLHYAVNFEI